MVVYIAKKENSINSNKVENSLNTSVCDLIIRVFGVTSHLTNA